MKNRLKLLQRISFLIFAIRSNFYYTTNTTKMQKIKLLKKNKASPFTRLLQNQLNIQQFVYIRHVFVKTAIFKPVVNYPGNFNTLLEKDISVFFGLCICINKKNFFHFLVSCEHLSHGHFFPTYIDLYSWSYFVYTFLRVTIYSLNYLVSHCHNVCIFSDSLYRIFCFVSFFYFISLLNGVQIW